MFRLRSLCRRLHRCFPGRYWVVNRYTPDQASSRYHVLRSVDGGPYLAVYECDTVRQVERYLLDQFL